MHLAWLVAGLALAASATGLLWNGDSSSLTYTTRRGETVETFGRGVSEHRRSEAGAGADWRRVGADYHLLAQTARRHRPHADGASFDAEPA